MIIVYQSETGSTKRYAEMLAKAEKLKCVALEQALETLEKGAEVIYMGPLMAGRILGADRAVKQFAVKVACGVGMSPTGAQVLSTMSKANQIPNAPMFYLQGGWAPKQVPWIKRRMVNMVTRNVRKSLQAKGTRRTREEQAYLDMLLKGGDFVAYENLNSLRKWLHENS